MTLRKLHNFTLLLFIFSIPIEYWDLFGLVGIMSTSRLAGYLYLTVSIFFSSRMFTLKGISKYILPLFLLIFWFSLMSLINESILSEKELFNFTFFQNVIFMMMVINHLRNAPELINKVLLSFSYSIFLLSIMNFFGIGTEITAGRITIFGDNSNAIGAKASIAVIIFLSMIIKKDILFKFRILLLLSIVPILTMLASTGSRGAFVNLVIGVVIILVFMKNRSTTKVVYFLIGSIAFYFAIQHVLENETMNLRIVEFIETRDFGTREIIWEDGLKIFRENVLFGVGETGLSSRMFAIYGSSRSVHNHFLYTLASGGLLGFAMLMYFFSLLVKLALRIYMSEGDILNIALLLIVALTMFKAGGSFGDKSYFLVFGIIISKAVIIQSAVKNKNSADLI